MTKTPLPPKDSWNRTLAVAIWEHIQPGNPHGPQDDLYFDMPYVRDSAERATRIANDLLEKGWRPPVDENRDDLNATTDHLIAMAKGHVNGEGIRLDVDELKRLLRLAYSAGERGQKKPITASELELAGGPTIIEPAKDIVSLVSAITDETVDMTITQALTLRLLLSIKGHQSDLYLTRGEELWIRCTCGKFDQIVGAQQDDLESLAALYVGHLLTVINAPKLRDLPDGVYFDGTYEWEKEGGEWDPINAPQGMPRYPEIDKLKRVHKTYEEIR